MSFGGNFDNEEVMSEINMTPLVDVMLVLLIIFMITLPVLTHSVNIDLPKANNTPNEIKPESVILSINEGADIYWNDDLVTYQELKTRLSNAAKQLPQPEFQLRGARLIAYEKVVYIMSEVQNAGIEKLGFVTEIGL